MVNKEQSMSPWCSLKRFRHERGVAAIEYALLAVLIALAIVGALTSTGDNNESYWSQWVDRVLAAISP